MKENITVKELQANIEQKQAEIKDLVAARNDVQFECLKPMTGKYYKNKGFKDQYMFVDFISKDTFRPFGYEINYKEIRVGYMHIIEDWVEISKEEFEKAFNIEVDRLRKEMKI